MDSDSIQRNELTDLKEQELLFFAKWSLIMGIITFGAWLLNVILGLSLHFVIGSIRWVLLLSFFLDWATQFISFTSAILAIVFAVLGKRRLTPYSDGRTRRKLKAGMVLAIVFLVLLLFSVIWTGILYYHHWSF